MSFQDPKWKALEKKLRREIKKLEQPRGSEVNAEYIKINEMVRYGDLTIDEADSPSRPDEINSLYEEIGMWRLAQKWAAKSQ